MSVDPPTRDGKSIPLSDLLISVIGVVFLYSFWRYPQIAIAVGETARTGLVTVAVMLIIWGIRQPLLRWIFGKESRVLSPVGRHRVNLPRPGLVYLVMMLIMALGSLLGHSNMLMLVFAMMAGPFVLNGWIVFSMLKRTSLERQAPARAMAGQPISVELTLVNRKRWFSSRLMSVEDEITNGRERLTGRVMFVRVPPQSQRSGHYRLCLAQRGRYLLGPTLVSSSFPLGLGERGLAFAKRTEILVYPRIGRLHPHWKSRLQDAALLVQRQRTRRGAYDDEFHRIREYRQGDNPRGIHWRSSARRNELMVKEYHQNREFDLAIVLDLWVPDKPTEDQLENVELAVSFAASLALEHMRECRDAEMSLLVAGADEYLVRLRPGQVSEDAILDQLALAEPRSASIEKELGTAWDGIRSSQLRTITVTTRTENDAAMWSNGEEAEGSAGVKENELVRADSSMVGQHLLFD